MLRKWISILAPRPRQVVTPEQCGLIKVSWKQAAMPQNDQEASQIGNIIGMLFYNKLFAYKPECKLMFTNVFQQSSALAGMLGAIVNNIDKFATVEKTARVLGERHCAYGVKANMFGDMETVLLDMLEERLGNAWTLETKHAWKSAYAFVSANMIVGLAKAQKKSRPFKLCRFIKNFGCTNHQLFKP